MVTGTMSYNRQKGRYGLLVMDLWEIEGFCCGDSFEVWDSENERWIDTRMEMHWQAPTFPPKRNDGWYLVGTSYRGIALEGLKIRLKIKEDTK